MQSTHSTSSSDTVFTRQDLAQMIVLGGDVSSRVEELFKVKAEQLITSGSVRKALIQARKHHLDDMHDLLEALIQQYIDEKIQSAEWHNVVIAYVEHGRYYALTKNFNLAKSFLESAVFYSKKPTAMLIPGLSTFKLIRELANYCIEYLKTLHISELDKIKHWSELHVIKYSLQQLLGVLGDIYQLTNKAQDQRTYSKYELLLADTYALLAISYNKKAVKELARIRPRSASEDRIFYRHILDLYRYVIIHSNLAKSILQKMESTEYITQKIDILNKNIAATMDKRSEIEVNQFFTKEDDESIVYLKSQLFNLVSDRNKSVEEVRIFIDQHRLDVNSCDDSNKVNNGNNGNSILEPSLIDHIVGAGRPEVLSLILINYPVQVSLFSTEKTYGIAHYISPLTMPGIREIVFDSNLPQYQQHPDFPLLKFFLDAVAGRVRQVQEYLAEHPDGILKIPESLIPGDPTSIPFVLHMAIHYKQLVIVRYLEKYIQNYIKNNNTLANINNLKILYKSLANCYIFNGWTEQRRKVVDNLMSGCLKILNDKFNEIKSDKNELTEQAITEILCLESQSVEFLLLQTFQYVAEAERQSPDSQGIEFYHKAENLYSKIFEIINKYEKNKIASHLADHGTSFQLLNESKAELAAKLKALETKHIQQNERLELYDLTFTSESETEDDQSKPPNLVKSKSEERTTAGIVEKDKKYTPPVFALPPGWERASGMFPPSPSSSPKTIAQPSTGLQQDEEFKITRGAKGG